MKQKVELAIDIFLAEFPDKYKMQKHICGLCPTCCSYPVTTLGCSKWEGKPKRHIWAREGQAKRHCTAKIEHEHHSSLNLGTKLGVAYGEPEEVKYTETNCLP